MKVPQRILGQGFLSLLCAFCVGVFVGVTGCEPVDPVVDTSPGLSLEFSDDTVYFDTLLTQLRSVTKRLRVYNPNSQAVNVTSIGLGANSPYSIVVNGLPGNQKDWVLRGKDSAYVLITVRVDPNDKSTPFVIEDSLMVQLQGRPNRQKVLLRTYGQNAFFYRNIAIRSENWTDTTKPYVLIDTFVVDEGATLRIGPGVKVYHLPNTFFIVLGRLIVDGTVSQPVQFGGYRQEPTFRNQSNQWGQILLVGGSGPHKINQAIIKNGFRGIQTNTPNDGKPVKLELSNTTIANMTGQGLLAFNSEITAWGNLIYDCGQNNLALLEGGNYRLYHNSFAYSGLVGFAGRGPGSIVADNYELATGFVTRPIQIDALNNLFVGTNADELGLSFRGTPSINRFRSNIIKSRPSALIPSGNQVLSNNLAFKGSFRYDFRPDSLSPAFRGAERLDLPDLVPSLMLDLKGTLRRQDTLSFGALQYTKGR